MKLVSLLILVISLESIYAEEIEAHDKGFNLVVNAFKTLINGEPVEQSYKDLFMDTSKNAFSLLETSNDQVTIDDLLRILIQTVIILVSNRRVDLMPKDFMERHPAYGVAIKEINKLLEGLAFKGTTDVTLKDLRILLKTFRSNEFWQSINSLNEEVAELIRLENNAEKEEL